MVFTIRILIYFLLSAMVIYTVINVFFKRIYLGNYLIRICNLKKIYIYFMFVLQYILYIFIIIFFI